MPRLFHAKARNVSNLRRGLKWLPLSWMNIGVRFLETTAISWRFSWFLIPKKKASPGLGEKQHQLLLRFLFQPHGSIQNVLWKKLDLLHYVSRPLWYLMNHYSITNPKFLGFRRVFLSSTVTPSSLLGLGSLFVFLWWVETHPKTNRQRNKQASKQTNKQTSKQTNKQNKQTNKQNRTKQTKSNQNKPNQTKPNQNKQTNKQTKQNKPNQTKPNQTNKTNQNKRYWLLLSPSFNALSVCGMQIRSKKIRVDDLRVRRVRRNRKKPVAMAHPEHTYSSPRLQYHGNSWQQLAGGKGIQVNCIRVIFFASFYRFHPTGYIPVSGIRPTFRTVDPLRMLSWAFLLNHINQKNGKEFQFFHESITKMIFIALLLELWMNFGRAYWVILCW